MYDDVIEEEKTLLEICCEKNYLELVELLVNEDNVNLFYNGDSLLDLLLFHKKQNIPFIKKLLKLGLDLNIRDKDNFTFLMTECCSFDKDNSREIVEFLLTNGARVDIIDNNGYAALDYLIMLYSNDNNIEPSFLETIKMLIKHGANVNSKIDNETLVNIVIKKGYTNTLKILTENEAIFDESILDIEFDEKVSAEKQEECKQIIKSLLIAPIDKVKQITSKEQPTEKEIELIINYINTQKLKHDDKVYNYENINIIYTLLEWACRKGHLEIVKLLITKENINLKTTDNNTLLILACMLKGNIKVVKYLVEKGADVNKLGIKNLPALIWAGGFNC